MNVFLSGSMIVKEMDLSEELFARIDRELRLTRKEYAGGDREVLVYRRNNGYLYLPRWYGLQLFGRIPDVRILDRRSSGKAYPFQYVARLDVKPYPPDQSKFVEFMVAGARKNGMGGIGVSYCGSGKTVMSVGVACALGGSTLILVHKEVLLKQWQDAITRFVRINGKPVRCGIIQEKRCEFGPMYPFSIGMVQSLSQRVYPKLLYASYRTIIVDETHHTPSVMFLGAMSRFSAKYLFGVTATLRRGDGMGIVFNHVLGRKLVELTRPQVDADVHFFPVPFHGDSKEVTRRGKFDPVKTAKVIAAHTAMNVTVVEQITQAYDAGRKCMVLVHERKHVASLYKMMPLYLRKDIGIYIGSRKDAALERAKTKKIIFGTYKMADEALDIPTLDMLFLVTPKGDTEQAVGRVLRPLVGKKRPLLVEFILCAGPLIRLAERHANKYEDMGWKLRNRPPAHME